MGRCAANPTDTTESFPDSVTCLAEFVEAIRKLPAVAYPHRKCWPVLILIPTEATGFLCCTGQTQALVHAVHREAAEGENSGFKSQRFLIKTLHSDWAKREEREGEGPRLGSLSAAAQWRVILGRFVLVTDPNKQRLAQK